MTLWDAVRELRQYAKELITRVSRLERGEGKYTTDGWTPSGETVGPGAQLPDVEIDVERTKFKDHSGRNSALKSNVPEKNNMMWDSANNCWKFYAVYKE